MPSTPPSPKKRRRGAQPGNTTARKHGLTPRPRPPEYNIDRLNNVDLTAEIAVLRRQVQRLEEAVIQASSLAESVEYSRVLAQTASALARLIRAQVIVFSADTPEQDAEYDIISEGLSQAHDELFLKDPPLSEFYRANPSLRPTWQPSPQPDG
jgi:hypothetical protein